MSLFIVRPRRTIIISDICVTALAFLLTFWVCRIVDKAYKKWYQKKYGKKATSHLSNLRGGDENKPKLQFTDDHDLSIIILSCIADESHYLVKSERLKRIIFQLAKAKMTSEALVITPNLIRLVAKRLIQNDPSVITTIGNTLLVTESKSRLAMRTVETIISVVIGYFLHTASIGILLMIILFDETGKCSVDCGRYFEKLPKHDDKLIVFREKQETSVIISSDSNIEIYTPVTKVKPEPSANNDRIHRSYIKSRKKSRQVTFEDFKKNDPVLSTYKQELKEPYVPQTKCIDNTLKVVAEDGFKNDII